MVPSPPTIVLHSQPVYHVPKRHPVECPLEQNMFEINEICSQFTNVKAAFFYEGEFKLMNKYENYALIIASTLI